MAEAQRETNEEREIGRNGETERERGRRDTHIDQRQEETAGKAVEGVEGKDGTQIEGGVGVRWRNGMWEPGGTKAGGGE